MTKTDKPCPQCNMVGFHKMSCTDPSNPKKYISEGESAVEVQPPRKERGSQSPFAAGPGDGIPFPDYNNYYGPNKPID